MEEKTLIRIDVRTSKEQLGTLSLMQIPNPKRVEITNISSRLMKEFAVKESTHQTMREATDYVVKEYFPASKGWTFEELSDEAYLIRKL